MGYSATHGRSCKLDIPAAWFDAALVDFPVLFTVANLPSEMFDADGSYPAKSDGSDVRFSSDSAGNTPLHVDIATFSINNNPALGTAEIHVGVPSCSDSVATSVYVWYNDPDASLPAADSATEGSEGVWSSSFSAVYHLQEANNTNAGGYPDSTNNDNHMTGSSMNLSNVAAKWGSGGKAADFDGTDDYTEAADSASLDFTSAMTISMWFKSAASYAVRRLITKLDYSDDHFIYHCEINGSNYLSLLLEDNDGTRGYYILVGNDAITQENWNHLSVAYDGATSTGYVYVNGGLDISGSLTGGSGESGSYSGNIPATTGKLYIDRYRYGASWYQTSGQYDEVRLSSAVRSAAWLNAEYNTGNAPADITVGTPSSPGGGVSVPAILAANMRGGFDNARGGFVN